MSAPLLEVLEEKFPPPNGFPEPKNASKNETKMPQKQIKKRLGKRSAQTGPDAGPLQLSARFLRSQEVARARLCMLARLWSRAP